MRLAGFFCLEGFSLKRKWQLVSQLRQAGASISYQIVASTRYLVIGSEGIDADRVDRARSTAQAYGVPEITEKALMEMLNPSGAAASARRPAPAKDVRVESAKAQKEGKAPKVEDKKYDEEPLNMMGLFDAVEASEPKKLQSSAGQAKKKVAFGKRTEEKPRDLLAELLREEALRREQEEKEEEERRIAAEREAEEARIEQEKLEEEERQRRTEEEEELRRKKEAEPPGSPLATSFFHCGVSMDEWTAARGARSADIIAEDEAMALGQPAENSDLDSDLSQVWWSPSAPLGLLTAQSSQGRSYEPMKCTDESTGEILDLESAGLDGASFEETRAADVAVRQQLRHQAASHLGLRRAYRSREVSVNSMFDPAGKSVGVENAVTAACGPAHRVVADGEGRIFAKGGGAHGRLGLVHHRRTRHPSQVIAVSGAVLQVACGAAHSVALTAEGQVWTWGDNSRGQCAHSLPYPTLVPLPTRIVFIACGAAHTLAVTAAGAVFAWGANEAGQLGLGHANDQLTPQQVPLPHSPPVYVRCAAAGGRHSLLLSTTGVAYATGANQAGQLGLGGGATRVRFEELRGALRDRRVSSISAGDIHSAAVVEGELYVWGDGAHGQLGGALSAFAPTLVQALTEPVKSVACGALHSAALLSTGSVCLLGPNAAPLRQVPALRGSAIFAGGSETLVLCSGAASVALQLARIGDVAALQKTSEAALASKDSLGRTPLHCAALDNRADVVRLLLGQAPQLIFATDDAGNTPLHLAASVGAAESLQILLHHSGMTLELIDAANNDGDTALLAAVRGGHSGVAVQLTEACADKRAKDSQGRTALHLAVETQQRWLVRYLVRHAAPLNITDGQGHTPTDGLDFAETTELKQLATQNDLFISYAHADIEAARRVRQALERHGLRCWMDEWRLEAGSDWRNDIGQGILAASALVFLASPTSLASDWCAKELQLATQHGRLIVPVWLVKTALGDTAIVRAFLRGKNFLDLTMPPGPAFVAASAALAGKCRGIVTMMESGYKVPPRVTQEEEEEEKGRSAARYCWLSYAKGDKTFASTLRSQLNDAGVFFCRLARHGPPPPNAPHDTDEAALSGASAVLFLVSKLTLLSDAQTQHAVQAARQGKRIYVVVLHRASLGALSASVRDSLSRAARFWYGEEATEALRQLAYALTLAEKEGVLQAERDAARTRLNELSTALDTSEKRLQRLRASYAVEHLVS